MVAIDILCSIDKQGIIVGIIYLGFFTETS